MKAHLGAALADRVVAPATEGAYGGFFEDWHQFEGFGHVKSVQPRHVKVEDHHVGSKAGNDLKRLRAAADGAGFLAQISQQLRKHLCVAHGIVDKQDASAFSRDKFFHGMVW